MVNWRSALALGAGAALVYSGTVLAQGERKLNDTEKKEIQAIVKIVDGPATGQPTSNDLGLQWVHSDLLKAQGNMQYVPFTVSVDTSKVSAKSLSLYWRVIAKNPPAEGAKDDKKSDKKKSYAYEDLSTIAIDSKSGPMTISRSFTVPPGAYDVVLVAKEPTGKDKNAPAKMAMIHQDVEVANLWDGEFTTSSIIVAKSIEPLAAPLTPQQQADRPYAMGAMEIVPAFSTKFNKQTELSTFMLIYNAKTDPTNNKPDVTVEYNFYVKQSGAEKFFNKTNPQALNAQTLPANFDFAAGHQLQSGQAVPLASFPEGDYRLEIKVVDKLASKTLMREINFSVSGS